MGILRGSYLKQNNGDNEDFFFKINVNLPELLYFFSSLQLRMVNNGDFEGFEFGVYQRVIREKQGGYFSEPLQRQTVFHPELCITPLPNRAQIQAKLGCLGSFLYHSFENPSNWSLFARIQSEWSSRRDRLRTAHENLLWIILSLLLGAERKTFKIANIRHLQLQGLQNTTIGESLRLF